MPSTHSSRRVSRAWFAFRAAVAVALTIAFYAAALGLTVWLGVTGMRGLSSLEPGGRSAFYRGAGYVLMIAVGTVVAISAFPRRRSSAAPGPEREPSSEPELFREVAAIAAATGQPVPAHVYVTGDVNAAVLSAGGRRGARSARRMIIGLPLLGGLTVSELRAVLAHEFGHFAGGDITLGPWIHRTQEALARTLTSLEDAGRETGRLHFSLLLAFSVARLPFRLYARVFTLITRAISRHQEISADELAARVVGAEAAATALRSVARCARTFGPYFLSEVAPIASQGLIPPVTEGFSHFLNSPSVRTWETEAALDASLAAERTRAYDTHPPTRVRIAALRLLARLAAAGSPLSEWAGLVKEAGISGIDIGAVS